MRNLVGGSRCENDGRDSPVAYEGEISFGARSKIRTGDLRR